MTQERTTFFANSKDHHINKQVTEALIRMDNYGGHPRGLLIRESFLEELHLHPFFVIQDFDSRPFNWKYFAGELYWYLHKSRGIEKIAKYSKFWNNIADTNGNVNSNYGRILFDEQIPWVVRTLRKDPFSRQSIALIQSSEYQYEGNKDFPCTTYLNFFIRNNPLTEGIKNLFMKVTMRSNDVFYGLCYDAPFFSAIQQTVLYNLGGDPKIELTDEFVNQKLLLGKYIHYADNLHYYYETFRTSAEGIVLSDGAGRIFSLVLKTPLFIIPDEGPIIYTSEILEFMDNMDKCEGTEKQSFFKELLQSIFTISQDTYSMMVS